MFQPILENADPRYRDMIAGFVSDKRNWVIPAYGIRKRRIDLTAAKVEEELQIKGDFVYADFNSSGIADVSLNSPSEDAFPLLALSGVQDLPYEKVYITSSAQPGLFINLWYGYRSRFISPTSAIATIGSITSPVSIAYSYGATQQSNGNLNAATPFEIFSPAANVAGAIIHGAQQTTQAAASNKASLLAKASAPAALTDGVVLLLAVTNNAQYGLSGQLVRPVILPAGLGLYWWSDLAETGNPGRYVHYTLL